jgi:CubicO group peptidase (beta-lactamase class C family)
VTDERTQRLLAARLAEERLAEEQTGYRLPSLAAGLARGGELVWSGGRGRIRGTDGPAPDADVQYRAGSITKTFIAVAVLRLRAEGLLDLSDPIGRYLDPAGGASGGAAGGAAGGASGGAAGGAADLTIGQLLSHTSGLRAETAGPWWERTPGSPFEALAQTSLGPDARRLRAGWQYHYSNVGYALLGELVTRLRGRPWYDVVAAELLGPLGMTRTTLRPQPPHAIGFAVHPHADLLLPEPEHDAMAMAPAGQLWTTVADLARWAGFLAGVRPGSGPGPGPVSGPEPGSGAMADELLGPGVLAEMRAPVGVFDVAGQPWTLGYGLGLQLWNEGGRRSYGHTGSMPGFYGVLQIDTASGDAAIALCNSTAPFSGPVFTSDLLQILAQNMPPAQPEWTPAAVARDALELVGTWYWGPTAFLVSVGGGVLEFRMAGSGARAFRFAQGGDGGWTGLDGYFAGEPLRPVRGPDGRVVALDLASHTYTRLPYDPSAPMPGGVDPAGWRG